VGSTTLCGVKIHKWRFQFKGYERFGGLTQKRKNEGKRIIEKEEKGKDNKKWYSIGE